MLEFSNIGATTVKAGSHRFRALTRGLFAHKNRPYCVSFLLYIRYTSEKSHRVLYGRAAGLGCMSFSIISSGEGYSGFHAVKASGAEGNGGQDEAVEKDPLVPFLAPWNQGRGRTIR